MRRAGYGLVALGSLALVGASATKNAPLSLTEVLGFVTGAWCVWLVVRNNIWNWPVGIANSAFYVIVFLRARLFADMVLQVVYIVLGFLGWYWWLHGGERRERLEVRHVGFREGLLVALAVCLATWMGTVYLRSVDDAAPFLDALTTFLSLGAQYLLTRKFFENWFVWIVADVVYIGLYTWRGLYLTSVLYAILLMMCVRGVAVWRRLAIDDGMSSALAGAAADG